MRTSLSFLALGIFFFQLFHATPARADRVARQVTVTYNACMTFLKMTPKQQLRVASRTDYGVGTIRKRCQLMKKYGLKKSIRVSRAYESGGGSSDSNHHNDPYGGSDGGFAGPGVCSGGVCSGPNGTTICSGGVCSGPRGTTICSGGVCSGPDGTTICSGGVCSGPNGTTICSGGVCN